MKTVLAFLLLCSTALAHELAPTIDYPVGHLSVARDPAVPNFAPQSFSEQNGPYVFHIGTDFKIREPDGTLRTLVVGNQPALGLLAVHNWCPSLDGQHVYYSHVRTHADKPGKVYCDIFKIPATGGAAVQLTNAKDEWSPPSGVYPTSSDEQVWNDMPCDTPDGLVYCSDRDGMKSPGESFRGHFLYIMRPNGEVERIDYMNFGGVLHPHYWKGWVYFATAQQQGLRARNGSGWGNWRVRTDGSGLEPVISAIPVRASIGWHNITHSSDGTTASDLYYDTRALGMIAAFPPFESSPFGPPTQFEKPGAIDNPFFWDGWDEEDERVRQGNVTRIGFQPRGIFSLLPWATAEDRLNFQKGDGRDTPPPVADRGKYQREVGHPWGVPGNRFALTWSGDNPEHRNLGVYLSLPATTKWRVGIDTLPSDDPADYLTALVDDPDRHEWYGKAIVSYEAIYGSPAPPTVPGPRADVPDGTPLATVGSAGIDNPEVVDGAEPFYSSQVKIDPAIIHGIRILLFNPTQAGLNVSPVSRNDPQDQGGQTDNREGFSSAANERIGHFPIIWGRKYLTPEGKMHTGPNPPAGSTPILRPDGRPDTSWLSKIPGNQCVTFQLVDENGRAIKLGTANTWHFFRPGELRNDCQSCHEHNKPDQLAFKDTAAARPDYKVLTLDRAQFVEYHRDIKPIDVSLGLNIGPRPFLNAGATVFNSRDWAVLANQALSAPQRSLLAAWLDTACMSATTYLDGTPITEASGQGPFADAMPPTLCLKLYKTHFLVGACDPQAGLKDGSLSVKSTEAILGRAAGEELADLGVRNGDVWTFTGEPKGTLTVSIRDNQKALDSQGKLVSEDGNITKLTRTVPADLPTPPEPPSDLEQEVSRLRAEVAALKAKGTADAATITELTGRIATVEAKIAAAKAALE